MFYWVNADISPFTPDICTHLNVIGIRGRGGGGGGLGCQDLPLGGSPNFKREKNVVSLHSKITLLTQPPPTLSAVADTSSEK